MNVFAKLVLVQGWVFWYKGEEFLFYGQIFTPEPGWNIGANDFFLKVFLNWPPIHF